MKVIPFAQAQPYEAPLHFDVESLRLQSQAISGATSCWISISHYEPGGRVSLSAGPVEKFYVMFEGELVVRLESGEEATLRKFDSARIEPNEKREMINLSDQVATLLVIVPTP